MENLAQESLNVIERRRVSRPMRTSITVVKQTLQGFPNRFAVVAKFLSDVNELRIWLGMKLFQ
jgi:hypothetical protein